MMWGALVLEISEIKILPSNYFTMYISWYTDGRRQRMDEWKMEGALLKHISRDMPRAPSSSTRHKLKRSRRHTCIYLHAGKMPVHIFCQEQLNLGFSGLIVFDSCAFTVPSTRSFALHFFSMRHPKQIIGRRRWRRTATMISLNLKLDYLY